MKKLLLGLGTLSLAILPVVSMVSCVGANEITLDGIGSRGGYHWDIDNIEKIEATKDSTNSVVVGITVTLFEADYMNDSHNNKQTSMWYSEDYNNVNKFINDYIARAGSSKIIWLEPEKPKNE